MRHPSGETITVTRAGGPSGSFDVQGNPVLAADSTFTVTDVAVAPTTSDETAENPGVYVVTGFDLYCPYGTVLRTTDRITIRGVDGWQVNGDTTADGWRNPFNGLTPGVVVNVRRAI